MPECQTCLTGIHYEREPVPGTEGVAGVLVHDNGSTDHPPTVSAGEGHFLSFAPTAELTPPPLTASHEERRAWQQRRAEHMASQAHPDPEPVSAKTDHQPGPRITRHV